MSLTTRVLLGLGLGLGLGIALATVLPEAWQPVAGWIEPVGILWTRALQMTVLPLVVTLLFTGVSSGGSGVGLLGARGVLLFLASLAVVAVATLAIAPAILALVSIDPETAASLRAASTAPEAAMPAFRDWLVALMPSNLFAAGASGAMLPIIVATLIFAAGASRLDATTRDRLEQAAEAVGAVTLVVVRGILALAPIGVFALAVPLALRLGTAALGAVVAYVIITVALSLLVIAALYPLVALRGVSVSRFARALAPAQGIALSARSSLAALPALIEGASEMGMSERATGFFLPFSASLYRLGGAVALPAGVLFIARLYGVDLGAAQLITVGVTSVLLTFSVPGIPGGSILIMAPVLLSVGLPVEGVGILLGVDTIPDMFRTTVNVTGTMTAAVLLDPPPR
jgi:Na+/H+-dicarboxylate symporter